MLYSLTGKIVKIGTSSVAVECGGVAFLCLTSNNTIASLSGESTATLYTYLHVREDIMELYGFYDEYELQWFKLLITVNGVGPKAALAILSEHSPDRLALCISAGDVKAITRASGIGPKIAQRIILDLKDKVANAPVSSSGDSTDYLRVSAVNDMPNTGEAVAALTMLGYSQTDAASVISRLDPSQSVEALIKQALKILSNQ